MVEELVSSFPITSIGDDLAYEQRLSLDPRWALSEGSRHFDEKSAVHVALRKICGHLHELGIPYAVAGGMALFLHGFRRFTEDVDILVTQKDLEKIHQSLCGRGYLPVFERGKNLRDTEQKVRIGFLVAGQYPGDGKKKPVAFPHPNDVAEVQSDIQIVNLPTLVELKLASGMTGMGRMKDLADVQELIKLLPLSLEFGEQLHTYVQGKYKELWQSVHATGKRYLRFWPLGESEASVQTFEELMSRCPEDAELFRQMQDDGVTLDPKASSANSICLVTTDPDVAKTYDMHDESEFLSDEE